MRKQRLELMVWAFVLSLAYYDGPFGFLAWLSLVRPFMILSKLTVRRAFRAAYFYGFFFSLFSLYWIAMVTPPGSVGAMLFLACYYATFLAIFSALYRWRPIFGIVALPLIWTGMEYSRTLSEFAFPWSDLGYTQSYYLWILQIVSIISVHGLTLLIVTVNVLIWQVFRSEVSPARRLTAGYLSVAIVVLLMAYGWAVVPRIPTTGDIRVTVLQGSVPIAEKWADGNEEVSFALYDSLAQSVADSGAGLYVWPETAAPTYLTHSLADRERIGRIARSSGGKHLVGALGAIRDGESYRYFNSCFYFDSTGRMTGRYDKMKLVPFTEQVPYQDKLPFLRREFLTEYLTFIETYNVQWWSDFRRGDSLRLFDYDDRLFGVLICFESTFPEFSRQMVLDGADFIVGITNDTWFGHSVGIHMHARIFLTRAVENRIWMVRAANSGVSYITDGYGRIRRELPLDASAALMGTIDELDGFSTFTKVGDVAGRFSFLITMSLAGILLVIWIYRKKKQTA